jgi:hypothetical protein
MAATAASRAKEIREIRRESSAASARECMARSRRTAAMFAVFSPARDGGWSASIALSSTAFTGVASRQGARRQNRSRACFNPDRPPARVVVSLSGMLRTKISALPDGVGWPAGSLFGCNYHMQMIFSIHTREAACLP